MIISLSSLAQTVTQTLIDYQYAVNHVSAYAYAVFRLNFPLINIDKNNILSWQEDIIPQLKIIPQSIVDFDDNVQASISTLKSALNDLIDDPKNEQIIVIVQQQLNQLSTHLSQRATTFNPFLSEIEAFSERLSIEGVQIGRGIAKLEAKELSHSGNTRIVQQHFQQLKDDLQRYELAFKPSSSLSEIWFVLIDIFPRVPWGIAVGGRAVLLKIVTDPEIIKTFASLKSDLKKLDSTLQNLAIAQSFGSIYGDLSDATQTTTQAIRSLCQTLNQVADEFHQLAQMAPTLNSAQDWSNLLTTLNATITEWQTTQTLAKQLAQVNYNYDPTPLTLT